MLLSYYFLIDAFFSLPPLIMAFNGDYRHHHQHHYFATKKL